MNADDGAPQREHRPVGEKHAGLCEEVDRRRAADDEGDVGEPEGERRAEIAAELDSWPTASTIGRSPGGEEKNREGNTHHSVVWMSAASQNVSRGCERSSSTMMEVWSIRRAHLAGTGQISARRAGTQPARA